MQNSKPNSDKVIGGLSTLDLKDILQALIQHPQIEEAWLFGSRAKGCYERGSDVDIALKGEGLSKIVTQLSGYLNEESPLPYFFDILDYHNIPKQLQEHIDRIGIKIYPYSF